MVGLDVSTITQTSRTYQNMVKHVGNKITKINMVNTHFTTGRKEGNVLFNDTLNTFYLWLYGIRHMVKDHSDGEKGNPLLPHRLLFPINSKGSFICIIPQTG